MGYYNRNRSKAFCQRHAAEDDCVADTLKNIIEAQDEADDDCSSGCNYSIQQLRGNTNNNGAGYNTVPFVLYCAGTCKPFIGSGIYKNTTHTNRNTFFGCVETPVFRAKKFAKNSDSCVILELLVPASEGCEMQPKWMDDASGVCPFFSVEDPVTGFFATGICLTVDLNHFMGITCLDPVNPM